MAQNRFVLELVVWAVRAVAIIAEDGTGPSTQLLHNMHDFMHVSLNSFKSSM